MTGRSGCPCKNHDKCDVSELSQYAMVPTLIVNLELHGVFVKSNRISLFLA